MDLNGLYALAKKNCVLPNSIFGTHLLPGVSESSAARVFASSGNLRSCSTRLSKSNAAGAGSFSSSGGRPECKTGFAQKCALKLLDIDFAVLVQNMSTHAGNHVILCVSRIALSGLQALWWASACRLCWNGGEDERRLWAIQRSPTAFLIPSG